MTETLPEIIRAQFRSRRNVALPHSALVQFYNEACYEADVFAREVTNKLPSLNPSNNKLQPQLQPQLQPHTTEVLKKVPCLIPITPRTYSSSKNWAQLFVPRNPEEFFGQEKPIRRCAQWLSSGEYKTTVLIVAGPSGTGKTSLAKYLLPSAMHLDFDTYEHTALRFCLRGGTSFFNKATKPSSGLVIHDFPCLPLASQKFILDLIHYFCPVSAIGLGFPMPIIFVMTDITPSFSRSLKHCSTRICMNRLSSKMLMALGYSLLRRTGHSLINQHDSLLRLSKLSCNAHHFVGALEDLVTGYRKNFFGTTDTAHSPFETVRKCWESPPNAPSESVEPSIVHWLAENTPQLLKSARTLNQYAEFVSQWDCLFGQLTYGDQQSCESVRSIGSLVSLATRSCVRDSAISPDKFRDAAIAFPRSIRSDQLHLSPSLSLSVLARALNTCF